MIVKPKVKNYICVTAHPEGCKENVQRQIEYVKKNGKIDIPGKVLVIGSSTGYGLASRICAAWSGNASTIGVCYEKPSNGKRTATAGWYNTAAFEELASKDGLYAKTIIGDAFSKGIKDETIALIKKDLGEVDLVIYSLAAPNRTMPDGKNYSSTLKTVGEPFTSKSLNLSTNKLSEATIMPAEADEIEATIHVMGGEDWEDWILALDEAGVLSEDAKTVAYSYIGSEMTRPIYADGTIGLAKENLCETAAKLREKGFCAHVSVNKALVTQSSSAIPVVPLYIAILYRVMKDKKVHENTIEQIYRLYRDYISKESFETDEKGCIRIDELELAEDVQKEVQKYWNEVSDENINQCADLEGYWEDFHQLFGFGFDNINYDADVNIEKNIMSLSDV